MTKKVTPKKTKAQTFVLDINPRARIMADNRQWIIQTRATSKSPWKSQHFISSTRGVHSRLIALGLFCGVQPPKQANTPLSRL